MTAATPRSAATDLYHSARLAAAYAFARPPVHPRIIALVAAHETLGSGHVARALDVGCGAGRSTAALAPLADMVVGIEPAAAMLVHRHTVAPGAAFVVGRAEDLPFADASFDLLTAAGALNYTDRTRSLAEIARVRAPGGVLAIYDFSNGRRCREAAALDAWFHAFESRYPFPPGYAMDVQALDYGHAGLRLAAFEPFEIDLPLSLEEYLAYALSEANVESAIRSGVPEADIGTWCRETLALVFGRSTLTVVFGGYIAYVVGGHEHASSRHTSLNQPRRQPE